MPTNPRDLIPQRGVPLEGRALHLEAVCDFRHTRESKPPILELKYPAQECNPSGERLPQLRIDGRAPEPVLKAAGLGLPAWSAGAASW